MRTRARRVPRSFRSPRPSGDEKRGDFSPRAHPSGNRYGVLLWIRYLAFLPHVAQIPFLVQIGRKGLFGVLKGGGGFFGVCFFFCSFLLLCLFRHRPFPLLVTEEGITEEGIEAGDDAV